MLNLARIPFCSPGKIIEESLSPTKVEEMQLENSPSSHNDFLREDEKRKFWSKYSFSCFNVTKKIRRSEKCPQYFLRYWEITWINLFEFSNNETGNEWILNELLVRYLSGIRSSETGGNISAVSFWFFR